MNKTSLVEKALGITLAILLATLAVLALASVASGACSPGEPCWASYSATATAQAGYASTATKRASEPCVSPYVFCPGETRVPPEDPWDPFEVTPAATASAPAEQPAPGVPSQPWEPGEAYIYQWTNSVMRITWLHSVPPVHADIWRCDMMIVELPGGNVRSLSALGSPIGDNDYVTLSVFGNVGTGSIVYVQDGFCSILADTGSGFQLLYRVEMSNLPYYRGYGSQVFIPLLSAEPSYFIASPENNDR